MNCRLFCSVKHSVMQQGVCVALQSPVHLVKQSSVSFAADDQPLQVARCTKIISSDSHDAKYIINVKQFAKFVVDLADQVAPTDIEEGMRVGCVWRFTSFPVSLAAACCVQLVGLARCTVRSSPSSSVEGVTSLPDCSIVDRCTCIPSF